MTSFSVSLERPHSRKGWSPPHPQHTLGRGWKTLTFCLKVEKNEESWFHERASSFKVFAIWVHQMEVQERLSWFAPCCLILMTQILRMLVCDASLRNCRARYFQMLHFTMTLWPGSFKWGVKINSRKNILIRLKYFWIGPSVKMLEISTYFLRLQWGQSCECVLWLL